MKLNKIFKIIFLLLIVSIDTHAKSQHTDLIEIKCESTKEMNLSHYHTYHGFTGRNDLSYAYSCNSNLTGEYATQCSSYVENWYSGGYATSNADIHFNLCVKYALYINNNKINTVGDLLEAIPATELVKLYDPNMVNN